MKMGDLPKSFLESGVVLTIINERWAHLGCAKPNVHLNRSKAIHIIVCAVSVYMFVINEAENMLS